MVSTIQQKILRAIGISLVTMLVLTIAQEFVQLSQLLNTNQIRLLLWILFPLFAILSGAAARFMSLNLWTAVMISLVAFSGVFLVLFTPASLVYTPVYVGLSLSGYGSARLFHKWGSTHRE
jgi:hypothetical protein